MGTFASMDIFFFYFFHELALIPTFIMIGVWGGAGRRSAAMEMTIYLTLGAMLSLIGIIGLYMQSDIASLSMVTDYDCWHSDHAAVSVEMVIGNLQANAAATEPILSKLMERLRSERPRSEAHTALVSALITPKDAVPTETRQRLDLLTSPYWGAWSQGTAN